MYEACSVARHCSMAGLTRDFTVLLSSSSQDIYPKRIPSPMQRERRKHARELELFLRERYGRERRRSQYRRNLINVNNWRETHLAAAGSSNPRPRSYTMATSASNSPASSHSYSRWRPPPPPTGGTRQHRRQQRRRQRRLRDDFGRSSPAFSRDKTVEVATKGDMID